MAQTVSFAPGVITTIAGTGTAASGTLINGDGGAATAANLGAPNAVATDQNGNFYIVDAQSVLRKVSASTGVITTLVGTGTAGFSGDNGPGTSAMLNVARGVCVTNSGDVYIGDSGNNRLRLYYNGGSAAASLLTTLGLGHTVGYVYTVGGGTSSGTPTSANGDGGLANAGNLASPRGCALDGSGNIFIADTNDNKIRKITASTGVISTVVGNGTSTDSDGVSALSTGLNVAGDVTITTGNDIVIAEQFVNKIRVVYQGGSALAAQLAAEGIAHPTVGYVYTIAGNGVAGVPTWPNGDGGLANAARINVPRGVVVDSARNIYIADTVDNRIRMVNRQGVSINLVGTGSAATATGTDGDGGRADLATLKAPYKVAVDRYSNLYIADDGTNRIRFVNVAASSIAFGSQAINSTSASQSVLLTNSGSATLNLTSISVPSGFQLSVGSGLCATGQSLPAGSSCTVRLTFVPTATGAQSAQLVVYSNALNGSILSGGATTNAGEATISVSGTGVASATSATNLSTSSWSVVSGNPVALAAQVTASVGNASGSVSFYDGTTLLATATLDDTGNATYLAVLGTGAHSLTAVYSGNGGIAGSTSPVAAEQVTASNAVSIPGPPAVMSNYHPVFSQNFTTMTGLSDLQVSASSIGSGSWIAHTPRNTDWFTFIDPVDNYDPFGIGDNSLTLRASIRGYGDPHNSFGGYSSGLLSSMDSTGAGFAQQYGYFEASMWCPSGLNTWPGFFLLDRNSLVGTANDEAEIDIVEQYGNTNYPKSTNGADYVHMTWWNHILSGSGSTTHGNLNVLETGLTKGYHLFGVDVEPDYITWYYDRHVVYQVPTYASAKRPLYVLIDMALGGANYNNASNSGYDWTLTSNPSDLKLQYVSVWSSPNSPNYVP